MSLITTHSLTKSFNPVDIFTDISISIPARARIGLVGANGVGKTTLLRILIGLEEPSSGKVFRARNLRIGYLPQEATLDSTLTLWDECSNIFHKLRQYKEELSKLEIEMANPHHAEAVIETYGRIQSEFEHMGGYTYETLIQQTLGGLGFKPSDLHRPLKQLSGGERTRASLAKLLLEAPDLLLLDEPTNHLDIDAIEWLESYLKDWQGAAVIVSHDRYFLDQVVSTIWEMTPAMETYSGNYTAYLLQRSERYQRRILEYRSQQAFIEKEEEYIRRNISGQNTRQAQGRRKRLERMLEEARLTPPPTSRRLHLNLAPAERSGDLVLRTQSLSIGFLDEGRPLFHAPDLVLRRGECAAILGPNGAGKTTFLKTLLGQVDPYSGQAKLGASLKIGYFAQAHESLHPKNTLMEEMDTVAAQMLPAQKRDYLARFMFTGDDVFKTIETLSGGERGRLALACLALQGANLLLLDEPTNHLDLPSQEVLQAVLSNFPGTILLVTHDRYLVDGLATQIWEVLPGEELLHVFEGTYSEYRTYLRETSQSNPATFEQQKPDKVEKKTKIVRSKNSQYRRQLHLVELETRISTLEGLIIETANKLAVPPSDTSEVELLGKSYVELEKELENCIHKWTSLMEE